MAAALRCSSTSRTAITDSRGSVLDMNLSAYLQRIGFAAVPRPDLATLQALQHAHVHSVPFENLDVQLGRAVPFGLTASFAKIVQRRRGGWCYEMNGVFGWALQQIGFTVQRLSAGVMRERVGDGQLGNHLCLKVTLDRPYLVDVGFGGSLTAPLPLQVGERNDAPFQVQLAPSSDHYWRFTEILGASPFSFDFRDTPADEGLLAAKCDFLQTDPVSPFVQNLVVQQRVANAHVTVRGRVLTVVAHGRTERRTLASAAALIETLSHWFNLDVPEVASLWPRICARHAALFPDAAQEGSE
jgi:N-hydroxyarylamine O-acetyltransferase